MIEAKDWITVAALVIGPVSAVIITLWYQQRTEKQAAKQRLFAALMSQRKSNPPNFEYVNALNLIDVVFQDDHAVVEKWRELYDELNHQPPAQVNWTRVGHLKIDLLSNMATSLGYRRLRQTDIDRFYQPQAHAAQGALSQELQTEFLRVLKDTQSLQAVAKSSDKSAGG
jgi:hypothetical protein